MTALLPRRAPVGRVGRDTMISGLHTSCDATGFVPRHASACLDVADRFGCAILFREPGKAARRLIEEGYGMKGFRIDTKSCNRAP